MRILRNEGGDENKFDAHFKERLRNLESEPSPQVWDKIGGYLDAEREKVKYDHWYYVALLLLIAITATNLYVNYNFDKAYGHDRLTQLKPQEPDWVSSLNAGITVPWDCPLSEIIGNNSQTEIPLFTAKVKNPVPGNKSVLPPPFSDTWFDGIAQSDNLSESFTGAPEMELESSKSRMLHKMHADKIPPAPGDWDETDNFLKKAKEEMRGIHFGASAGLNTGWLFFKKKALVPVVVDDVKRNFDWGSQYALSLGYDFSDRFGVQADWVFISNQGQKFQENRYRKILLNTEINMSYMHLPVMFKYKWSRIGFRTAQPQSLNVLLGVQYSRMRAVDVVMNDQELVREEDIFGSNELGLIVGLEYDFFLHKNYYLTAGARTAVSSETSIFKSRSRGGPDYFNVFLGANLTLNYFIPVKKRMK